MLHRFYLGVQINLNKLPTAFRTTNAQLLLLIERIQLSASPFGPVGMLDPSSPSRNSYPNVKVTILKKMSEVTELQSLSMKILITNPPMDVC
jgi:hypothetical protein